MAKAKSVHEALGKHKGNKLHSHSVKYERADNGGLHAHVERHTSSGHHHTEHHVLADSKSAQEHLEEHLGDHPSIGAATPIEEAEPAGGDAGAGGAAGGAASPAPGADVAQMM